MYNCDICDSQGDGYFSFNDNFGYCDNPDCKKKATEKNRQIKRENILYDLSNSNFQSAFDELGDEDIFDLF